MKREMGYKNLELVLWPLRKQIFFHEIDRSFFPITRKCNKAPIFFDRNEDADYSHEQRIKDIDTNSSFPHAIGSFSADAYSPAPVSLDEPQLPFPSS